MDAPKAVESVEIHILVDNVTDSLSTVPSFVETKWAGLGRRRRGSWVLAGSCMCCAAHGLRASRRHELSIVSPESCGILILPLKVSGAPQHDADW